PGGSRQQAAARGDTNTKRGLTIHVVETHEMAEMTSSTVTPFTQGKSPQDPHILWQVEREALRRKAQTMEAKDGRTPEVLGVYDDAALLQWRIETTPCRTMAGVVEQLRSVHHAMQAEGAGLQQRVAVELAVMSLERM